MVVLYFSGTGNSKHIAELFSRNMNVRCYSIEADINFSDLMDLEETIVFCYPVYGSRVPRIMREFVKKHLNLLNQKKLIIFCTQLLFSGDGARAFTDMFPRNYISVIYAEHFFMPNNISNFALFPRTGKRKINKCLVRSERKMEMVCRNIRAGIIKRRGFNCVSKALGLIQGAFMPRMERKAKDSVKINNDCTHCQLCVSVCPMNNLEYKNDKIIHNSNCTICYRCVNKCPQKAITVFVDGRVKEQYKPDFGIGNKSL